MKAPKKPRAKSAAAVAVPQSREDVINDIRKIGDITRVILRRETELNDKLAELTNDAARVAWTISGSPCGPLHGNRNSVLMMR